MQIITVHGRQFGIDTADWLDRDDADRGGQVLASWVRALSADDAARIHKALLDSLETLDGERPADVEEIESEAYREATEGYARDPDTGHNMSIVAIAHDEPA